MILGVIVIELGSVMVLAVLSVNATIASEKFWGIINSASTFPSFKSKFALLLLVETTLKR